MGNNKPIKVLHIISDLRRGGRERQLSILVHHSKNHIDHQIVTFHSAKENYVDEYNIENVHLLNGNKFKKLTSLYKLIKKENYDLIHSWGNTETIYSIFPGIKFKIPVLNGSIRHGITKKNFSHSFRSFVLRRSKYVLGNSRAGFEANKIKFDESRHFIIYNGIEDKFFVNPNQDAKNKFLAEKNLSGNSNIFISIANLVPYKDYFTTIRVLGDLNREGLDFHYIIIGKGPMKSEIEEKIRNEKIENKVTIYSDQPDIPKLLSLSDIMIHSSLGEGCSNAILEGSAAGLVIVASNTGGTKEIINDPDLLFKYKNEDDLKSKIKLAIQKFRNDNSIKQKISESTKEKFSLESFLKNYEIITNRILSNNST